MSKFTEYIGSQFAYPRGLAGKCCCLIMNVINKAMYRAVINQLAVSTTGCVLDVGYGNGYLVSKLHKKLKCDVGGIDVSEDMKAAAVMRNRKAVACGKVNLCVGDCCDMPFVDGQFDAVTTVNTVYFWENVERGFEEIFRVLKNGGAFYNAVYTEEWLKKLRYTEKGFRFFKKEDFFQFGKSAGFSKVDVIEIIKEKSYLVRFVK